MDRFQDFDVPFDQDTMAVLCDPENANHDSLTLDAAFAQAEAAAEIALDLA